MEETILASCCCVAKIFKSNCSQTPREHTCTISLVKIGSNYYLQQEGNAVKKIRQKIKGENINKIETRRLSEGYLTIILISTIWETVALFKADVSALRKLINILEELKKRSVRSSVSGGSSLSSVQSSSEHFMFAEQLPTTPSIMRHPNNVGPTSASSPSATKHETKGFYGSSSTPESFLPDNYKRSPGNAPGKSPYSTAPDRLSRSPSRTPQKSPVFSARQTAIAESPVKVPRKPLFYSARRNLIVDVEKGAGQEEETEEDFKPNPKFRSVNDNFAPTSVDGFANFGNTCYMNAVLQSLVGMEPFAMDILNHKLVQAAQKGSLYLMLYLLVKSKRSKDSFRSQSILLKKVRGAISSRAAKFGGYRQQDAQELLGQCLDQVKDELSSARLPLPSSQSQCSEPLCPVIRNFECEILRTITCKNCGAETKISEVVYDFALQLPKSVLVRHNQQANLQQLFESYFAEEEVEYACKCDGKTASLKQQLARLPRIMILHLKRYGYSTHLSKHSKRVDHIRIPRFINIGDLCASSYTPPIDFKGPWPRDSSCFSTLVAENKENTSPTSSSPSIPIADVASVPMIATPPTPVTALPHQNITAVVMPNYNGTKATPPSLIPIAPSIADTSSVVVPSGNVSNGKVNLEEFYNGSAQCVSSYSGDSVVPELCPVELTELSEEEALRLALEESMKEQQAEVQFLHDIEEEQLKMALDMSIKESSGVAEAPPSSPVHMTPAASPIPTPSNVEAYKLVSVVSHLGKGSGGGHYISDVYSIGSKSWRTYNDEFVSEVREEDVRQLRQTTGYIFFYMHRTTCKSVERHCK